MSITSRHFKNSVAWGSYSACGLLSETAGASFNLFLETEIPTTVSELYIDKENFFIENLYSPKRIKTKLVDGFEYIVWLVEGLGSLKEKRSISASSGLAVGSTSVVLADNVKIVELPVTYELINGLDHTMAAYQFITNLPISSVNEGHILNFKGIDFRIFDIRRKNDCWVLACTLG